jgi:diketogulonate reductase-like aldo/keto reductase
MSDNHRRQRCTPADIDGQRQGIQDNLRSLRVGQLAAVNLRLPGGGRVDARFDDQLAAMAAARDEGLIAGVGLNNVSLEQLRHAVAGTGIVCVQNLFHLAFRYGTPVLEECLGRGIAFVPFCPLGWPRGQHNPVLTSPVVIRTAARLGITPAQVALQWLLRLAPSVLLIPGTGSVAHLRETWPPNAWRSMTRRCATWTPLHHGQTIRLKRCEAMTTAQDSARGRTAVVTACAGAIGTAISKALQEAGHCYRPLHNGEKIAPVDQPGSCLSHLQRPASISTPGTTASATQSRHRPSRSQATVRAVNGARTSRPALPRSGESPRSGDDQSPAWWQT